MEKGKLINDALDAGDVNALQSALQNSVFHHHWYSLYTSFDYIEDYNGNSFELFFGNPRHWNDDKDKEKYFQDNRKLYFVRCLSYQKSESIAMWYMYGYPNNIRIKIPYSILKEGLMFENKGKEKLLKCDVLFNNGTKKSDFIKPSSIEKFDILYYAQNEDKRTYFTQKGSMEYKQIDEEKFKRVKGKFFMKRFAFASEVESRIQIALDKDDFLEHLGNDGKKYKEEDIIGIKVLMEWKDTQEKIAYTKRPDFIVSKNNEKQDKSVRTEDFSKNFKQIQIMSSTLEENE